MIITDNALMLRRPDNWHHHFRDDFRLDDLLIYTVQQFARAVAMPNLPRRVKTQADAQAYWRRIVLRAHELGYIDFEPVMTIYMTEETTPDMLSSAFNHRLLGAFSYGGLVPAAKIYPKGGTTESGDGIVDYDNDNFNNCLRTMAEIGMLCLIHCEVPDQSVDPQEREQRFMPILRRIHERHPTLKIVVEHISSRVAVETVCELPDNVAATVTCHHLFLTKDDLHDPHNCCMPRAKTAADRQAIRNVVLSGHPKFFFGGDDAPHHRSTKDLVAEPAHGVWCGPTTMPLLASFFEDHNVLDKLEPFVSEFGARFYGLPLNEGTLTLRRVPWRVPDELHGVVPFGRGQEMPWRVVLPPAQLIHEVKRIVATEESAQEVGQAVIALARAHDWDHQ